MVGGSVGRVDWGGEWVRVGVGVAGDCGIVGLIVELRALDWMDGLFWFAILQRFGVCVCGACACVVTPINTGALAVGIGGWTVT